MNRTANGNRKPRSWPRRVLRVVLAIPAALVLFVLGLLLVLSFALHSRLVMGQVLKVALPRVNRLVNADIRVGGFSLRLLPPHLEIEKAVFTRAADAYRQPFSGADRIVVDISLRDGLKGKLHVTQVEIWGGWNYLYIDDKGLRNLPDFPSSGKPSPPSPPFTSLQLPIIADRVILHDARWGMDMPGIDMVIDVGKVNGTATADMDRLGWGDADLTINDVAFRLGRIDQRVSRLDVVGGFSFKKFYAEAKKVHLEGPEAVVDASGRIDDLLGEIRMNYRATVAAQLSAVNRMFTPEPRLAGTATVEATLDAPTIPGMTIDATLALPDGTVNDLALRDLTAKVHMTLKRIDLERLAARLAGGSLAAQGRVDLPRPLTVEAQADLASVGLGPALRGYGIRGIGADGAVSGSARTRLVLSDPLRLDALLDLALAGASYRAGPGPALVEGVPLTVRGNASMAGKTVKLDGVQVAAPHTTVAVDGSLRLPNGVDGVVKVASTDLADFSPLAGAPLGGTLNAGATLSGKFSNLNAAVQAVGAGLRYGAYGADALNADVALNGDRVRINGLKAQRGKTTFTASGEVDLAKPMAVDLTVDGKQGQLEDLAGMLGMAGKLAGPFDLSAKLSGPLEEMSGTGSFSMRRSVAFGEGINGLDLRFTAAGGVVTLERFEIGKGGGRIDLGGTINPFKGDLNLTLATQGLHVADIDAAGADFDVQAALDAEAQVTGTFQSPQATAKVSLAGVQFRDVSLGDVAAEATLQGKHAVANVDAFAGQLAAGIDLDLAGDRPYSAAAYFEQFDLAILSAFAEPLRDLTGVLQGQADAAGTLADFRGVHGSLQLDTLRIAKPGVTIQNDQPIRLAYAGGGLTVQEFHLAGTGVDLRVLGPGPAGGVGSAALSLDMAVLNNFVPAIGESSGTLALNLRVGGSLRHPEMAGTLALDRGTLSLLTFPQPLENIVLAVDIAPEAIQVRDLAAEIGGGTIQGGGSVQMKGFSPARYDLFLRGSQVATGYAPAYVDAKIDRFDLLLSGAPKALDLAGDVYLDHATYSRNVNLPWILAQFQTGGVQSAEIFQRKKAKTLTFNIAVHGENNLRFRNNLANVEAAADVILTGDNTRYGLLGDVTVLDGQASVLKADYDIQNGLVQFFDERRIFPVFDITAKTTVSNVAVTVNVSGNPDHYNLAFSSDPPQSDRDIVALLTGFDVTKLQQTVGGQGSTASQAGSTSGSTSAGSSGEAAGISVAAQVVTGQLNTFSSKYVGLQVGVDTGPTGQTRLKVTRGLAKDLSASYFWEILGQGIGAQVEYDFLRFMSVLGTWENNPTIQGSSTIGAFGGVIQFKLDFQ